MAQLRQEYEQFQARDTEVVVVGPDNAAAFSQYWEKESLPFVGLPDPGKSVLKQYGQEINLLKLGRMPAQVVVDRSGVARYAHYGHDMADIPGNEELFAVLDQINSQHVKPETTNRITDPSG